MPSAPVCGVGARVSNPSDSGCHGCCRASSSPSSKGACSTGRGTGLRQRTLSVVLVGLGRAFDSALHVRTFVRTYVRLDVYHGNTSHRCVQGALGGKGALVWSTASRSCVPTQVACATGATVNCQFKKQIALYVYSFDCTVKIRRSTRCTKVGLGVSTGLFFQLLTGTHASRHLSRVL